MIEGHTEYRLKPIVMPVAAAHNNGWVSYRDDGTLVVRHPRLKKLDLPTEMAFETDRQFSGVQATFDDLNKALSRLANSPRVNGTQSLRETYDEEMARYEEAVSQAQGKDAWEVEYGSYVLDHWGRQIYVIAPEPWHRLALVTSNSKLSTDPEGLLSWRQIRQKLEGAVIGFAGLSVGGNVLEGWLREARPRQVKIADPDWLELTNFNRCERASLRHLVGSRAERFETKNPYEAPRVGKAEYIAYEQNLVDPYLEFFVYREPLSPVNAERFLLGDGVGEPPVDILVDEIDDLDMKVELRRLARKHRVDVLMMTDFGHRTQVLWNPFRDNADATFGPAGNDAQLLEALAETKLGQREKVFEFVEQLCRCDFRGDPFERFTKGEGEQPTASLPQSGTTTMLAGGIGAKELVMRILGLRRTKITGGIVYDFLNPNVTVT